MLKVTGVPSAMPSGSQSFFNVDSRKKQVTLYDPAVCGTPTAPEDRRVGVAAPKMFAFDAIFTQDDSQNEKIYLAEGPKNWRGQKAGREAGLVPELGCATRTIVLIGGRPL
ncbi:hypothetical protein RUM44_012132 [Polyplax serrata]|uniref:Uncharacterized protein n=1 Tax=Polyplax serrata TaxID=468196 RepID=A0ABR1BAE8_POLSC